VGERLREGEPVCEKLPLGEREGAEADAEADPAPPPGVALRLADRLPLPEAAGEGEAGEADTEGLPEGEAVCACDPVERWLFEAEPVMEALAAGERVQLTVTLCVGDCEAQGLALGEALENELGLGHGEAVAETFPLRLALECREADCVLVRSVDPEAAALADGNVLAERV
jgi:hypothetical protein